MCSHVLHAQNPKAGSRTVTKKKRPYMKRMRWTVALDLSSHDDTQQFPHLQTNIEDCKKDEETFPIKTFLPTKLLSWWSRIERCART